MADQIIIMLNDMNQFMQDMPDGRLAQTSEQEDPHTEFCSQSTTKFRNRAGLLSGSGGGNGAAKVCHFFPLTHGGMFDSECLFPPQSKYFNKEGQEDDAAMRPRKAAAAHTENGF